MNTVKKNEGFSLVEIIIVIAVMAILTGVIAPMFVMYVEKARESVDLQDMDSALEVARAIYAAQDYPQNVYYYYFDGMELGEEAPAVGYGRGGSIDRHSEYDRPCCENGEYHSNEDYKNRYLIIVLPERFDSGDQTIHVHWSE